MVVGAYGDFLAEVFDLSDRGDPGRGEPALLVELPRIREVGLRDDSEDLSPRDRDGDVEEASVDLQRGANEGGEAKLGGSLANLSEGLHGTVKEGPLAEEVAAAVARQAELGEDDYFHPLLSGFFQGLDDQGGVGRRVPQTKGRLGGRHGHKTVLVDAVGHQRTGNRHVHR